MSNTNSTKSVNCALNRISVKIDSGVRAQCRLRVRDRVGLEVCYLVEDGIRITETGVEDIADADTADVIGDVMVALYNRGQR